MVGLLFNVGVKWLQVYSAVGLSVFFGTDNHPVARGDEIPD